MAFAHGRGDGAGSKLRPVTSLREEPNVVDLMERRQRNQAQSEPDLLLAAQTDLAKNVQLVQQSLAYLAGAVEPETLGAALVGTMGNAAEEIREQLRPLREALRDQGGDAA